MTVKNGDFVLNYNPDECLLNVGKVKNLEGEEHDMEFFDGGSVSPVGTSESYVVSERLAKLVSDLMDNVPTDEDGMFIFKDEAHAQIQAKE